MAPPGEAAVDAVSGVVGSVLALLATFPLKTIYTLQALSADKRGAAAPPVMGVLDIIAKYRLQGLYVGIGPSIFETGLSSAVYFYLYARLRELAVQAKQRRALGAATPPIGSTSTKNESIGVVQSLVVAALAGVGNQLLTMPASVVITRMQAQQKRRIETNSTASAGAFAMVRDIWSESGPAGFWAGLLPALILVSNPAIQFMLYEQLLRLLRKWRQVRQQQQQQQGQGQGHQQAGSSQEQSNGVPASQGPAPAQSPSCSSGRMLASEVFLASALAKIGATVATYPMIVVKSRMQAAGKATSHAEGYGTLQVINRTLQDEGVGGFFKGLRAKILQTALNAALMLMLKEQCYNATRAALASTTGCSRAQRPSRPGALGLLKAA